MNTAVQYCCRSTLSDTSISSRHCDVDLSVISVIVMTITPSELVTADNINSEQRNCPRDDPFQEMILKVRQYPEETHRTIFVYNAHRTTPNELQSKERSSQDCTSRHTKWCSSQLASGSKSTQLIAADWSRATRMVDWWLSKQLGRCDV